MAFFGVNNNMFIHLQLCTVSVNQKPSAGFVSTLCDWSFSLENLYPTPIKMSPVVIYFNVKCNNHIMIDQFLCVSRIYDHTGSYVTTIIWALYLFIS